MNAVSPIPAIEPGISSRVPFDEYFQLPALSMSQLKEIRRSPLHYLHALAHPKASKPLSLGTAAHCAVLEPERFATQFAVWDRRTDAGSSAPRRGQYWDAFCSQNAGKTIITADERDDAINIQCAVRANPLAMRYLETGDPEVTLRWMQDGRACRGRVDWLTTIDEQPVLTGLKTARDCRHYIFGSAAAKLAYHWSWAFYFDGYRALRNVEPKMVEIVVESAPPYAVAVYIIPQDIIDQGRDEYTTAMARLAECERDGHFPGPQEQEEPLSLPSWVFESQDDIGGTGLEW